MKNIKDFFVNKEKTIKEIMKQINKNARGIAFVLNSDDSFLGVVTDGDIRRALINGASLDEKVENITNTQAIVLRKKEKNNYQLIPEDKIPSYPSIASLKVPILDSKRRVVDIFFVFKENGKVKSKLFSKLKKPLKEKSVKKILVIGGAGYLGSVLCRKLLRQGYQVKVLESLVYGDEGIKNLLKNKNFKLIKGDIRSIDNVIEAIKDVEAVIHLAALVGDPASSVSPQKTLEVNYHSAKMIAEIAKYYQINRFIFASTCSVYGKSPSPGGLLNEESGLNPVSLYARTKVQSEKAILEAVDENFSPTIFRLATLYGMSPRMRFDLVINLLTAKAVMDKEMTIFGGDQWRPFLHLQDAADAFIRCIEAPINKIKGEVFNVGSNELNCQIIELGRKVSQLIPDAKMKVLNKKVDKRDYKVDFNKINKIFNFKAKYSIEDGILEIKEALERKKVKDFCNRKYYNYRFLNETSIS